jgi:type IV pilus assembly protein PilE
LQVKPHRSSGFTLIELMIVVAVIAVLAAVALPTYQSQVRKSRRAEAITFMSQVQQAQERYRANIAKYGDRFVLASGGLTGVISDIDPNVAAYTSAATSYATSAGYYVLGLSGAAANGYTVGATAQGDQANDGSCKYMQMKFGPVGSNIAYDSGTSSTTLNGPTSAANDRCWNR